MITFQDVSKAYGGQKIISQASFHVSAGGRVGLIGPNGAGKTTLFRLIMDAESPDEGQIHRTKNLSIGALPQEAGQGGPEPLIEMVMAISIDLKAIEGELEGLTEALAAGPSPEEMETLSRRQSLLLERYENLDGYSLKARTEKILEGLGFQPADFARPVSQLSGGWRMRALLARILLADPDLILLDEPTNHLDLASLLWLEEYLAGLAATIIIVSHDRAFLNRSVNRIIELDGGRLGVFAGDYDAYVIEKKQQLLHQAAAYRQQQEKIKQIKQFIARNRSRKDRAKQVQSRLKTLEKMERLDPPEGEGDISFSFPQAARPPAVLVSLEEAAFGYDPGRPVFRRLNLQVRRGDRISLIGPNGAGKSSLLKLLAGQLAPEGGRRVVGTGVRLAYFAQHQLDQLSPHLSVIEELMQVSGAATQTQLRTLLGGFLFRGDDVSKKVSVLSGGERSRLVLAKLLFSGANLLLLDEPTNHLDIPSRLALERALAVWPGAVCLVAHDRRLINAVTNRVWEVSPGGKVEDYPGNLEDFLTTWQRLKKTKRPAPASKAKEARPKAPKGKARRRLAAEARQRLSVATRDCKARLAQVEDRLAASEARVEELSQQLADPQVYQDPEEAVRLSRELGQAEAGLERLGQEWAETASALEEASERFQAQKKG